MADDDIDALAGEYVLGTLDAAARCRFEARLAADDAAARAVAAWEARLLPLAGPAGETPPPPRLWTAIRRRLDDESGAGAMRTIRADAGWEPYSPGIAIKRLHVDADAGMRSFLLRLAPGAVADAHHHPADEECLVLEGELVIGDLTLRAGDYHLAPKGVPHPALEAPAGALLFVRAAVTA